MGPGPGLRKRRMSDTEVREFSLMKNVTVKSEDVACNQNPASLRLNPGITPQQYSNPSTNPTTKSGEVMYLDSPDTEGNEARKSRLIAEAEEDSEDELCRELEIREDYNDLDEL